MTPTEFTAAVHELQGLWPSWHPTDAQLDQVKTKASFIVLDEFIRATHAVFHKVSGHSGEPPLARIFAACERKKDDESTSDRAWAAHCQMVREENENIDLCIGDRSADDVKAAALVFAARTPAWSWMTRPRFEDMGIFRGCEKPMQQAGVWAQLVRQACFYELTDVRPTECPRPPAPAPAPDQVDDGQYHEEPCPIMEPLF